VRFGAFRLSRNPVGWAHVAGAATQSWDDGGEGSESGHFSDPFRLCRPLVAPQAVRAFGL